MRKQSPGGSGGVEINISAKDLNALSTIEKTQKGIAEIAKSATGAATAIGATTLAIAQLSSGAALKAVTNIGSAIGAVSSAISGLYGVSQIPLVAQQLEEFYKAGIQATESIAPLSSILKGVGETSVYLGENFLGKGLLPGIVGRLKPLQESIGRVFSSGVVDFAKNIAVRVGSEISGIQKRLSTLELPRLIRREQEQPDPSSPDQPENKGRSPQGSDARSLDIVANARALQQLATARAKQFGDSLRELVVQPLDQISPVFRKKLTETSAQIRKSLKDFSDRSKAALDASGFKEVAGRVRDGLTDLQGRASSRLAEAIPQSVRSRFSSIRDQAKSLGEGVPEAIQSRIAEIRGKLSEGVAQASAGLGQIGERIATFSRSISDKIPSSLKEGVLDLKARLLDGTKQAADVIRSAWGRLPDALETLRSSIPQEIQGRFAGVKTRISEGLQGIGEVLKTGGRELVKIVQAIGGNFPSEIQKRLDGLKKSLFDGAAKVAGLFRQAETAQLPAQSNADLAAGIATRDGSGAIAKTQTLSAQPPSTAPFEDYRQKLFEIIDSVDRRILSTVELIDSLPGKVSTSLELVSAPAAALAGINEPREIFEELKGVVGTVSEKIGEASQQIFFFTSAFDSLQALVANGPYQMLVGQNVELRKQLLQTQASLVSTNKIMRDGMEIRDPTAAIQALDAPVNAAIAKIRRDSLELVGVTSKDLVGVFNTINQSASQANISLSQSADLTSSFAAALGTIGLPLNQASQEINSILTAQIDQNSVLAKTLSLDNERVRQLAQQGKLYDFLTDKLKAFRAGNALAAKTIEGVSSNIQEVFDNITLEAGAQLIEPIVEQLTRFYNALSENQSFLTDYVSGLVSGLKTVGLAIASIIESFGTSLGGIALQIPEYLFKELAAGAIQLADAIKFVLELFRPFFELISMAAQFIVPALASPFLKVAITLKLVAGAVGGLQRAFKILMQLLPGFGQLLALITIRSAPLLQQFINLRSETGNLRVAFGLLLGKELTNIPGAMAAITNKLGVFGALVAPLIPQVSQFAIAMIGINKQFGITKSLPIAGLFQEASNAISSGLLPSLAAVARSKGLTQLADQVDGLAEKTARVASPGALVDAVAGKVGDALGIDTSTKKVTALQGAINGVNNVIGTKLLPAFASVAKFAGFQKIADQADDLAVRVLETANKSKEMSKFDQVVDGVTQNIGKSVAKSAIAITGWTAAIAAAVIVVVELWKRSEDAGDQVTKLSQGLDKTAALIRSTWDETRNSLSKPLVEEEVVSEDWLDKAILGIRKFEKAPLESIKNINSLRDAVTVFAAALGAAIKGIGQILQTISDVTAKVISLVVGGITKGIAVIATFLKNPFDKKGIEAGLNDLQGFLTGRLGDIGKRIAGTFGQIETKGEESFRELSAAIKKGGLEKSVDNIRSSIDGLEKEIEGASGGAGALFAEELAPITTALQNLDNGTGSIQNVKDAIASVSQQFPNLAKDLQGVSAQLATEFPGDMLTSGKSVEAFGEAIVKLNNEGKPGLEGIATAIDNFKAGKGSISEIKGEIEKYKGTLTSLDDKKQIEALAAPIDAFSNSLKSLDANASNARVADISATIEKDIEKAQALLKEAEKGGVSSPEASAARAALKDLEAQRDRIEKLSEGVKVLADPYLKLQNQLGAAKESIEKTTTDIANNQKQATARIRKAAADGIDMETGEKKLITDSQARILTLQQETQAIEEEIPARYKAVEELLNLYNSMSEEEKQNSRGKDLKRQIDTEQSALYEAAANGAEKRAELEKAIAEKAISDIDRANKLALEKSEKAETDRLVMLTQMRNQGLITAEDFERRKADAGIESAKTELKAQEDLVKKLEALPKPNDPDEARDREDRIRAEKLKTSQLTLKLLDAERAAYEAQTRVILASLEKQNNRRRAALEESSRSGLITDSEKAEKESELEIQRVRRELSRERDSNKRAELELQLEKAKSSKVDATRRRQQDEFDRAQAQAEAEQLRAQREGGADAEKSYAAALERRLAAARRGVEIAKDANEKAKANLELQKVLNDLEVDRIDRNLKAIENSYKRQNQALQKQTSLLDLAEKSLSKQRELIDSANQLRQSVSDYYDQTLGVISSLEKSDYRRRQLAEVTATIKLQAAIQEVKIAEQTLAIEQQMKRLALEREKIQARIAENEKLGNIKRLEAEEKKAKLRGASPEEIEAIRIERDAAVQDYELSKENTRLVNEQAVAQEQIFEMQRRVQDIQGKGKIEAAAGNLIQNMADPVNRYNAGERYKEYLAQQLGAGNYQQLREGGLQGARDFQEQFFGQGMSRQGLMRGQSFDISQAIADRQNQAFSATLPGAATRPQLPASSAVSMPTIALPQPQLNSIDAIASNVAALRDALGAASGSNPAQGATVTITALNINGSVSDSGKPSPDFSNNFRRELEKVFNEAGRLAIASST